MSASLEQLKDLTFLKSEKAYTFFEPHSVELPDGSYLQVNVGPVSLCSWLKFKRYDNEEDINHPTETDPYTIEEAERALEVIAWEGKVEKHGMKLVDHAIMAASELKFHIALPDRFKEGDDGFEEEEALRNKAWGIITDVLFDPANDVHSFKLLHPNKRHGKSAQHGKDVAVYPQHRDTRNPKTPKQWVTIMEKLSNALAAAGIPPRDYLPEGGERETKPLGDSPYVCYRFGESIGREALIDKKIQDALDTAHFLQPLGPDPTPGALEI